MKASSRARKPPAAGARAGQLGLQMQTLMELDARRKCRGAKGRPWNEEAGLARRQQSQVAACSRYRCRVRQILSSGFNVNFQTGWEAGTGAGSRCLSCGHVFQPGWDVTCSRWRGACRAGGRWMKACRRSRCRVCSSCGSHFNLAEKPVHGVQRRRLHSKTFGSIEDGISLLSCRPLTELIGVL